MSRVARRLAHAYAWLEHWRWVWSYRRRQVLAAQIKAADAERQRAAEIAELGRQREHEQSEAYRWSQRFLFLDGQVEGFDDQP